MGKFLIKRILLAFVVLYIVLTVIFVLMRLVPGNPIYTIMADADHMTQEELQYYKEMYGLDGTIFEQYVKYMRNILKLDFGKSLLNQKPVFQNIIEKMDATLVITIYSTLISLIIGIPLGIFSATHRNSFLDYFLSSLSMVIVCIPSFCVGIGLLYVFAFKLQWFPLFGYRPMAKYGFFECIWSVTLPSVAMGLSGAAGYARHTRSQMLDVLNKDYIRTARSKGMTERVINYRHALKNVLAVMITMVAGTLVAHLGGSTVLERVFNIKGVGLLAYSSLTSSDYTQEQAILLFFAAIFVFVNIILDIVYKALDPRIDLQ